MGYPAATSRVLYFSLPSYVLFSRFTHEDFFWDTQKLRIFILDVFSDHDDLLNYYKISTDLSTWIRVFRIRRMILGNIYGMDHPFYPYHLWLGPTPHPTI